MISPASIALEVFKKTDVNEMAKVYYVIKKLAIKPQYFGIFKKYRLTQEEAERIKEELKYHVDHTADHARDGKIS